MLLTTGIILSLIIVFIYYVALITGDTNVKIKTKKTFMICLIPFGAWGILLYNYWNRLE